MLLCVDMKLFFPGVLIIQWRISGVMLSVVNGYNLVMVLISIISDVYIIQCVNIAEWSALHFLLSMLA